MLTEALSSESTTGSPTLVVDVRLYVTGARPNIYEHPALSSSLESGSIYSPSPDTEKNPESFYTLQSGMKVAAGRPDIRQTLEEEVTASLGPVSVDGV